MTAASDSSSTAHEGAAYARDGAAGSVIAGEPPAAHVGTVRRAASDRSAEISVVEISRAEAEFARTASMKGEGLNRSSSQTGLPKWLGGLALGLLLAGTSFAIWRSLSSRNGGQLQMPMAFPVKMERLQASTLEDSAEFVGRLDAQAGVSLQPEADGRIVQIFVSSGDRVAAGDPIVQLSPERSQSDYNAALASVSAARSARDSVSAQLRAAVERQTQLQAEIDLETANYGRTETLVARGALPQETLDEVNRDLTVARSALTSAREEILALQASLDQAESTLDQANANANATQQDLFDRTVTAPIAGVVGDMPVKLGDYVQAGDPLATVTQNDNLELNISVPVEQARQLQLGLPVELTLFGQDSAIATGNIRFISPTTDPSTQTVLAKARFSTPSQPLQDDQRLGVRVIWDERPGILVPATAISRLGGQTFVFVPGQPEPPVAGQNEGPPSQVARLQPVTLGDLQGNDYQVLEGLQPGDTVITSGLLNLRDGVPIQLASPEGQSEQQAQAQPES